ncbi:MAG: hypothetical protein GC154_18030 [bacterium]|nr:hypothetical protein [bacterium]
MSVALRTKGAKRHVRCAVCGIGFAAEYDELLKAYPVFHLNEDGKERCEDYFFSSLLRVYRFIHNKEVSVTMSALLNDLKWIEPIQMRKELISWCLSVGYLNVDNFNRFLVPPSIATTCEEIFASDNLDDPTAWQAAVEMLMAALRCLNQSLVPAPKGKLLDFPGGGQADTPKEQPKEEIQASIAERSAIRGMVNRRLNDRR